MRVPRILPLVAIAVGGVVALRVAGVAPGLFEGTKAWAEGVVAAAPAQGAAQPAARPAPAACALSPEDLARQAGLSPAELRLIQNLKARRGELDARDTDFATQLPLLVAAEQKLDGKITTMNGLKTELQTMLGQADQRQQAETDRLVQVYSAMRPRDAAHVFETLDDSVRLPVAAAMRPRSLAAVMAQMNPAAARLLTEKLAHRFDSADLAQRTAQAAAPVPVSPASGAAPPTAPAPTPVNAAQSPGSPPTAQPAAARPPRPRPQRTAARRPAPRRTAPRPSANANAPAAAPASTLGAPAAATPRQSVE